MNSDEEEYVCVLRIGKDVGGRGHGPLKDKPKKDMKISQNCPMRARESNSGPPGYEEGMRITIL
jgi:hypothetical protein